MSLGLKDLQKKTRPVQSKKIEEDAAPVKPVKTGSKTVRASSSKTAGRPASFSSIYAGVQGRQKFPAGAWSARGITARPWTDSGLSKSGRNRKPAIDSEATMNEEWINLFSTPWFWVECGPESRFIRLQLQLQKIEEQIQQKFRETLEALEEVPASFFGGAATTQPFYAAIKRLPILRGLL